VAKVAPRALRIGATKHAVPNPLDLQLARSITCKNGVDKLAYQRGGEGCSASVAHQRNKARSAKSSGFAARKE